MPLTCKQYELNLVNMFCVFAGGRERNHSSYRKANLLMNKIHRKTKLFTVQSPSVVHIT
jgi:hypothetical protein